MTTSAAVRMQAGADSILSFGGRKGPFFASIGDFFFMKPTDTNMPPDEAASESKEGPVRKVRTDQILADLRAGLRTRGFMNKYGLTMGEFERLLKKMIQKGIFTREEYIAWKASRRLDAPTADPFLADSDGPNPGAAGKRQGITTYVIKDPEKNDSWALKLFSTQRNQMQGAAFKVDLHGKRYSFVVEEMLFRGPVTMLPGVIAAKPGTSGTKDKREEAIEFISEHGWAAYLESRAIEANLSAATTTTEEPPKARLVLLHCRNNTFLAALHTPAPAINLYVGSSLDNIKSRLAKSVDTSSLSL